MGTRISSSWGRAVWERGSPRRGGGPGSCLCLGTRGASVNELWTTACQRIGLSHVSPTPGRERRENKHSEHSVPIDAPVLTFLYPLCEIAEEKNRNEQLSKRVSNLSAELLQQRRVLGKVRSDKERLEILLTETRTDRRAVVTELKMQAESAKTDLRREKNRSRTLDKQYKTLYKEMWVDNVRRGLAGENGDP